MLTERIPDSHYHSDFPLKHPNKKVILVNKATNYTQFCESKSLNVNEENKLCFSDLINDLKPLYPELHRAFFFIYIDSKEYLIGADPFQQPRYIDFKVFENSDIVILYTEQKNHKKKPDNSNTQEVSQNQDQSNINSSTSRKNSEAIYLKIKQEDEETNIDADITAQHHSNNNEQKEIYTNTKPREKRVKERTIEYVIEKVKKWRTYYEQGVTNELGEDIKPNLDVAAYLVQLSRKTLDDYYAQLRKGEMYNFDFQSNKHEKMGTLRKYVKEQEKQNPNKKNKGKLSDIIDANSFGSVGSVKIEEEKIIIKNEEIQESQRRKKSTQINSKKPEIIHPTQENLKMETEEIEQNVEETNNYSNSTYIQQSQEDQNLVDPQIFQQNIIADSQQQQEELNQQKQENQDECMEMEEENINSQNICPQSLQQQEIQQQLLQQQQLQQIQEEQQRQKFRFRGYDQTQYDLIMNDLSRQSPIKSHKGSADVCDEFLDLNSNCQYSNFYE